MARPRKPDAERLSRPIAVRLTNAERDALLAKAAEAGISAPDFVRLAVRAVLAGTTQVVVKQDSRDYDRLLYAVNKAGNNLNQLAHRAHTDSLAGRASEATYGKLLAALQMIGRTLRAALDGRGP